MIDQLLLQKMSLEERVKNIIRQNIHDDENSSLKLGEILGANSGKMLRTGFASYVLGPNFQNWPVGIDYLCAAVELIHTASLFHDDVIDGATIRRGNPTIWKMFSPNAAILLGDTLYCKSLMLLIDSAASIHLRTFTQKVYEVCSSEAEQELVKRGEPCDFDTSVKIARSKTGALFAMIGRACGGDNEPLTVALEEAGYRIGTAYQLADDLIDEFGDDRVVGKTLGTDRLRNKFTLAHQSDSAQVVIKNTIHHLCESSLDLLAQWPTVQDGVERYSNGVLLPACGPAVFCNAPASVLV